MAKIVIQFTNEIYVDKVIQKILSEVLSIDQGFNIDAIKRIVRERNTSANRWCIKYDDATKSINSLGERVSYTSSLNTYVFDYEFLGIENIFPFLREGTCVGCGKENKLVVQLGDGSYVCHKCMNKLRIDKES